MSSYNILQSITLIHLPKIAKVQLLFCSMSLGYLWNMTPFAFLCDFYLCRVWRNTEGGIGIKFDLCNVLISPEMMLSGIFLPYFLSLKLTFKMLKTLSFFLPSGWFSFTLAFTMASLHAKEIS